VAVLFGGRPRRFGGRLGSPIQLLGAERERPVLLCLAEPASGPNSCRGPCRPPGRFSPTDRSPRRVINVRDVARPRPGARPLDTCSRPFSVFTSSARRTPRENWSVFEDIARVLSQTSGDCQARRTVTRGGGFYRRLGGPFRISGRVDEEKRCRPPRCRFWDVR